MTACDATTTLIAQRCDISLSALSPDAGAPGTLVTAEVNPVTKSWDTVVHVGGTQAAVSSVARTDCEICDTCRAEEGCGDCDTCGACDDVCRDTCIETVQFSTPDITPGSYATSLVNRHGQSNSLLFTVLAAPDTGGSDTAPPDSGDPPADTGTLE
jgi:hypothetical protein